MIKVSIVGSTHALSASIAYILAQQGFYELWLIGEQADRKADDVMQGLSHSVCRLYPLKSSKDFSDMKHSDVVIVLSDLSKMSAVGPQVKHFAPDAFVIMGVDDDRATWSFQKSCDWPEEKIVGVSGAVATERFKYHLAQNLNIDIRDIQAIVMGSSVPLLSHTTIAGIRVAEYVEQHGIGLKKLQEAMTFLERPVDICFSLCKSVAKMVEAYAFDQKRVITCSANLNIIEPENDVFLGLPVIIGGQGVEMVCAVQLSDDEEAQFRNVVSIAIDANIALSLANKKLVA